jgi:hypothetical protein
LTSVCILNTKSNQAADHYQIKKSTTIPCTARDGCLSPPKAEKSKITSVILTVHLQPGAEHPVCLARTTNHSYYFLQRRGKMDKKKTIQNKRNLLISIFTVLGFLIALSLILMPGNALARNIKVGIIDCYSGPPAVFGKDALKKNRIYHPGYQV